MLCCQQNPDAQINMYGLKIPYQFLPLAQLVLSYMFTQQIPWPDIVGLFVVRPILSGPARLDASDAAGGALALPPYENGASPALDGELDGDADFAPLAPLAGGEGFGGMGMVDFDAPVEEDPVDRLRTLIEARKDETVEILRSWLDEKEEVQ